jgi:hypothetical protein
MLFEIKIFLGDILQITSPPLLDYLFLLQITLLLLLLPISSFTRLHSPPVDYLLLLKDNACYRLLISPPPLQ